MDILEANFPQYFNRDHGRNAPKPDVSALPGDRGLADDALIESGDAVQCDQDYLDGLLGEMDYVTLRVILWILTAPRYSSVPHDQDPAGHYGVAKARLVTIKQEIRRLRAHPQLFKDVETHKWFWGQALFKLKNSKLLIEWKLSVNKTFADMDARIRAQTSTNGPVDSSTGLHLQPWVGFQRTVNPTASNMQGIAQVKARVPDMELHHTFYTPPPGVVIAEEWRKKTAKEVLRIANTSKEPDRVLKVVPQSQHLLGMDRTEGQSAVTSWASNPMTETQLTRPLFAWGPQDPAAESARLMAMLDHGRRPAAPGVWSAKFLTEEANRQGDVYQIPGALGGKEDVQKIGEILGLEKP